MDLRTGIPQYQSPESYFQRKRGLETEDDISEKVLDIISGVVKGGDRALKGFTLEFDGVEREK